MSREISRVQVTLVVITSWALAVKHAPIITAANTFMETRSDYRPLLLASGGRGRLDIGGPHEVADIGVGRHHDLIETDHHLLESLLSKADFLGGVRVVSVVGR